MVSNLSEALQPVQLLCSLLGFFYIREDRMLVSPKTKKSTMIFIDIIEGLRCICVVVILSYLSFPKIEDNAWRFENYSSFDHIQPNIKGFLGLFQFGTVSRIHVFYNTYTIF